MASGGIEVRVVNPERILKKLDPKYLAEPILNQVFERAGHTAERTLRQNILATTNGTGASARKVALKVTGALPKKSVIVTAPRHPLIFLEAGSHWPVKAGERRSRRRRQWSKVKRADLRIKPRRFLRKTYTATRRELPAIAAEVAAGIERRWAD